MKRSGVTQEAIAERMDITQGAVAHWLSGRREINLSDFFTVCDLAHANPQTILFGESNSAAILEELRGLLAENPQLRELVARSRVPEVEKRVAHKSVKRRKAA